MGLIERLRRITTARIEAFLNTIEDPEVLFPQLIKEMEEQVRAATDAEAKAMAAVKGAERELEKVKEKIEKMGKGAELAVQKGDDATARDAVGAQINLEADLKRREETVARSQGAFEDARDARQRIQGQLDELRAKKDEILTRVRVADTQRKIERTVHGPVDSSGSILDAVAKLEAQVDEAEAELAVKREMSGTAESGSLDKRLDDLSREAEIEKRLAALKSSVDADEK